MIEAYPLNWPEGRPRTQGYKRTPSRFDVTFGAARNGRKPTWLLANTRTKPLELNWSKGEQRLPEWMVLRYGYEKARRIGVVAMVGGKNKTAIRNATPEHFRDVLLAIARQAHNASLEGCGTQKPEKCAELSPRPSRSDC